MTADICEVFKDWSGGFEPESDDQIEEFLEAAAPEGTDDAAARKDLKAWMNG